MSESVCVGPDVIDAGGNAVSVLAAPDGTVVLLHAETGATELDPAARDALRELLDRAAMPGQVSDDCPIEAVLPDGHHPCTLKRGHAGIHDFADEPENAQVTP
jgi:hypothetical protein